MINERSILAVIPARAGSKGLPGKNKKPLNGRPLVTYPLGTARDSQYVDDIFLSTDDPEILEMGDDFDVLEAGLRPAELARDDSSGQSVIRHVVAQLKERGKTYDYLLVLEPTSPLTEAEDVDRAVERLEADGEATAIVGISRTEGAHPYFSVTMTPEGFIAPLNPDKSRTRRQEIPDVFFYDGSLYLSETPVVLEKQTFYHEKTLGYVTPKWKSFEIDDIVDFLCVEAIMQNKDQIESYE